MRASRNPFADRAHNPVAFRFAVAADAESIAALAVNVFLDTYATEATRTDLAAEAFAEYGAAAFRWRLAQPQRKLLLAEQGTGLIGFAEMLPSARPAPGTRLLGAELVRLYVQPHAQRHGIGRALLRHVEAIVIDEGLSTLWFTVWEGNANALAFYARQGYAVIGATTYSFRERNYRNHVMAREVGQSTAADDRSPKDDGRSQKKLDFPISKDLQK